MTNSTVTNADSENFYLLEPRIQKWIWNERWTTLRDAQEQAIPALIDGDRDVIIAAATAAGKTEAAFFPILTHLLRHGSETGLVLYISPLKALINDQWGRLSSLCELLDIPVIGWHGDVAASRKQKFLKNAQGILLITPESVEALFVRRGTSMPGLMVNLRYVVVDELHAFIGSERGKQLQSLLHRLEKISGHSVPRVGLSATLGDMALAREFLRPKAPDKVELIQSGSGDQEIKTLIKGYEIAPSKDSDDPNDDDPEPEDVVSDSILAVASHIYKVLRGSNNLIFPNSRQKVEQYADLLRRHCERDGVPNEFWAHHGSLSKEFREEAERALKDGTKPASAICTTTLELGIDIGAVKSVCQIGAPPSVASLRQRLGRSGRREGEPAILRGYCLESQLSSHSGISDLIREGLVQMIAMVRLIFEGWAEPPSIGGLHGSTFIQQILSVIAQQGGASAGELWVTLVDEGPFGTFSRKDFSALLRHLVDKKLLMEDSSGTLLHGELGEKFVNNYEFYAAFISGDEFRLLCDGKVLGSLPVSRPLIPSQRIIFAGRRWRVLDVDAEKKIILVKADKGGAPPLFEGGAGIVHDRIRQEMRIVLSDSSPVPFIDRNAGKLLAEARDYYQQAKLDSTQLRQIGSDVVILTWLGDRINDSLSILLTMNKLTATNEGVALMVSRTSIEQVSEVLKSIANMSVLTPMAILADAKNILREKWDWALPDDILKKSYASLNLDVGGARTAAANIIATL